MKINVYGRVHVTYENGVNGPIHVRGGCVPGGTAFVMLDIEYRDLTYDVEHLIWRAIWDAEQVAIIGPIDAAAALAETLAWKDGQRDDYVGPTDADDVAAETEAFNAILADIADMKREAGQ